MCKRMERKERLHEEIRRRVMEECERLQAAGVRPFIGPACEKVAPEFGYKPSYIENIYYGRD